MERTDPRKPRPVFLRVSLLFLAIGLPLVACGGGGGGDTPGTDACPVIGLGSRAAPRIINGTECRRGESPVVYIELERPDGRFSCTGTMLTSTDVLTAAHCVFAGVRSAVVAGGSNFVQQAAVARVILHPEARVIPETNRVVNDVAVLRLNRALALPTLPLLVGSRVDGGEIISIFGFGQTETGARGTLASGEMKVRDVDQLGINASFEGEGSNTCFGDSGGPALLTTDLGGRTVTGVVGVTSAGQDPNCAAGDLSFFADVQSGPILSFLTEQVPGARIE